MSGRDRAAVFIDGGYLKMLLRDYGEPLIDYVAFTDELCRFSGGAYRLRTYFYDCLPYQSSPPTEEEKQRYIQAQKFIYTLQRKPRFQVRLGRLQKIPDPNTLSGFNFTQKRIDVLLTVDLVRMSTEKQIQKAILVTGDSDFVPAVSAARDKGVEIWVWFGRTQHSTIHDELLGECDECRELTFEFINSIPTYRSR